MADTGKLPHLQLVNLYHHNDDYSENYDDDDGVGGDDGGQCVHRHEGQVRSSGTAHCSTATWQKH